MQILVIVMLILAGGALILKRSHFSFAAQTPAQYAGTVPAFDIRTVLSGPIVSEGVIFGPSGAVASRFVAQMHGTWEGERGVLTEDFRYDNGTLQHREWSLRVGNDGSFTATAPDVIGTAQGMQSGATVRMTYRIRLTEAAGGHELDVIDWLYLSENGTVLNRSEMRKFGVKVAELIATMRPANDYSR